MAAIQQRPRTRAQTAKAASTSGDVFGGGAGGGDDRDPPKRGGQQPGKGHYVERADPNAGRTPAWLRIEDLVNRPGVVKPSHVQKIVDHIRTNCTADDLKNHDLADHFAIGSYIRGLNQTNFQNDAYDTRTTDYRPHLHQWALGGYMVQGSQPEVDDACRLCRDGHGRFRTCRRHPNIGHGACGCCLVTNRHRECTLSSSHPANPAGPIRTPRRPTGSTFEPIDATMQNLSLVTPVRGRSSSVAPETPSRPTGGRPSGRSMSIGAGPSGRSGRSGASGGSVRPSSMASGPPQSFYDPVAEGGHTSFIGGDDPAVGALLQAVGSRPASRASSSRPAQVGPSDSQRARDAQLGVTHSDRMDTSGLSQPRTPSRGGTSYPPLSGSQYRYFCRPEDIRIPDTIMRAPAPLPEAPPDPRYINTGVVWDQALRYGNPVPQGIDRVPSTYRQGMGFNNWAWTEGQRRQNVAALAQAQYTPTREQQEEQRRGVEMRQRAREAYVANLQFQEQQQQQRAQAAYEQQQQAQAVRQQQQQAQAAQQQQAQAASQDLFHPANAQQAGQGGFNTQYAGHTPGMPVAAPYMSGSRRAWQPEQQAAPPQQPIQPRAIRPEDYAGDPGFRNRPQFEHDQHVQNFQRYGWSVFPPFSDHGDAAFVDEQGRFHYPAPQVPQEESSDRNRDRLRRMGSTMLNRFRGRGGGGPPPPPPGGSAGGAPAPHVPSFMGRRGR